MQTESSRLLLAGANVVFRIRQDIKHSTGFTVSGGVAANRVLAKLASARNKPNKQTIVPLSLATSMMRSIPFKDVRGLGGKFGARIEAALTSSGRMRSNGRWHSSKSSAQTLPVLTCGDVLDMFSSADAARELAKRCEISGEQAATVLGWVRGEGMDEVKPNLKPKSLNACKSSFLETWPELHRWLTILAEELVDRMGEDELLWHRRATTLVVHHRGALRRDHLRNWQQGNVSALTPERNRQCRMPIGQEKTIEIEAHNGEKRSAVVRVPEVSQIVGMAERLLRRLESDEEGGKRQPRILPCSRIAMSATEFADLPTGVTLTTFFTKKTGEIQGQVEEPTHRRNALHQTEAPRKRRKGAIERFFGDPTAPSRTSAEASSAEFLSKSTPVEGMNVRVFAEKETNTPCPNAPLQSAAGSSAESEAAGSSHSEALGGSWDRASITAPADGDGHLARCDRCQRLVPAHSLQEHQDWHMATELQKQLQQERAGRRASPKIDHFFRKVPGD